MTDFDITVRITAPGGTEADKVAQGVGDLAREIADRAAAEYGVRGPVLTPVDGETHDRIAEAIRSHHTDDERVDYAGDAVYCVCGELVEDWEEHWGRAAVAALAPTLAELERLRGELAEAREAIEDARNYTTRGRCRSCGRRRGEHQMRCRLYAGLLEHHWQAIKPNGTFGGMDYFCTCGGWFRQGGMAGHGDGTENAEPVCPNADQDWRGPREESA